MTTITTTWNWKYIQTRKSWTKSVVKVNKFGRHMKTLVGLLIDKRLTRHYNRFANKALYISPCTFWTIHVKARYLRVIFVTKSTNASEFGSTKFSTERVYQQKFTGAIHLVLKQLDEQQAFTALSSKNKQKYVYLNNQGHYRLVGIFVNICFTVVNSKYIFI